MKFKLGEKVCYSAKSIGSTYRPNLRVMNINEDLFVGTIIGIDNRGSESLIYLLCITTDCENSCDVYSSDRIRILWGKSSNITFQHPLMESARFIWFAENGIQKRCKCRNK